MDKKFLEEHPNITLNKVVKEGDPGNEFYQAVASGTAPDLVNCSFTMMDSYITSGILEPLNQYTDEWDEWGNFTKEYVDMFTKDGKVYGVPNQVAPMLTIRSLVTQHLPLNGQNGSSSIMYGRPAVI